MNRRNAFTPVELPAMRKRGFTLIELLVVVSIIVVLIAILVPALDKARDAAIRAIDLTNLRSIAQTSLQYATSYKNELPPYKSSTGAESDSYDQRNGGLPTNLGYLAATELLPKNQLGKVLHCPSHDNLGSGTPGHCMDVESGYGRGASWWNDKTYTGRIITSYSFRAPSWQKNKGSWRTNKVGGGVVLVSDLIDVRFRGTKGKYAHAEGYNRSFVGGHAGFFADPPEKSEVERQVKAYASDGRADGRNNGGTPDEQVFEYMAVDR